MKDLIITPVFSGPLLALALLTVAAAIAFSFYRGIHSRKHALLLGAFRLAALLLLAVILLIPQKRYDEVTVLRPQIAVVVDTSESMVDPVDETQPRRADRVKEALASPALKKAAEDFDIRLFSFDAKLNELPKGDRVFDYKGTISNVGAAVNQVQERFRGQPLAAILLYSDGLDTSGLKDVVVATGAPVFAFELENPFTPKVRASRISLANVDFPARVVVGWDAEIHASVMGVGMSGKTTAVELWRNGTKQADSSVSFNDDEQTRTVEFPVSATEAGVIHYELRVTDTAADTEAKNYPFMIEALPPGKRILYIQNTLGFDFKFLRKAVVSDRNLQLNAFVRWGDGRLVSMGERGVAAEAKLDMSAAGLSKYSVVILGDLPAGALPAESYQALKEFVSRGGGLVLMGGAHQLAAPDAAQLALNEISPVKLPADYKEGNVEVQITDTGLRHPVFGPLFSSIKDFPPLLSANISSASSNPTTEVLVEGTLGGRKFPVIATGRFGQGRVVCVMTDTIWRWRLASKSWSSDRSPYDTFWTQLMDWLIPKEQEKQGTNKIELFTERSNYLMGEHPEMRAIVRLADEKGHAPVSLPLTVKTPDGKRFDYTMRAATLPSADGKQIPGYRVVIEPNMAGIFVAKSETEIGGVKTAGETRFVVAKPATELTGKPLNREFLKQIAEQTAGRFFSANEREQWPSAIHFLQKQFATVQVKDLWNKPILLLFLLAALCGDWILRKRWNLP